jgi:outer membrane protein OmpA-like peptidoglycan-associated protein
VYAYENGGTRYAILKVAKDDAEAWAQVSAADNGMYQVIIIERQLMRQDVPANADMLAGSINETGKAAVFGIYFDTGKSEIKPESEPAIAEIVKLLEKGAAFKLYVVGHTDTVGAFEYNVKLSQARAAAVVGSLVKKHGIAASRLIPFGVGPTAPVESTKSDEGRAKNRRVELVKQ